LGSRKIRKGEKRNNGKDNLQIGQKEEKRKVGMRRSSYCKKNKKSGISKMED
jgi:hypothetical protein